MGDDWTNSEPKIVPDSFTAERVIRAFLADTLNFLRGRRSWPDVEGELSDWLMRMHGVQTGNPSIDLDGIEFRKIFAGLDALCGSLRGIGHDEIRSQLAKIGAEVRPKVQAAQQSGDSKALDSVLSQTIPRMMNVVGMPENFSALVGADSFGGFVRLLRATRAMSVSLALFHEHPLSLIAKAFKGDRRATLDLIKVDHMFINDRCCKETIRRATLQEDVEFMAQVQRALSYKPRVHRRELLHFYIFNLFLFEQLGITMPPTNELWMRLDPLGREYGTLQAFEKDVQRRKRDFQEIVKAGEAAAQALQEFIKHDSK